MSKDYLDKWEERAKKNTEIIEKQQTKTKMSKEKLVGMICKERLQTLEENHPFFGIKKVLTPYLFKPKQR